MIPVMENKLCFQLCFQLWRIRFRGKFKKERGKERKGERKKEGGKENTIPAVSVAKTDLSGLWQCDSILNNAEIFSSHAKIHFIPSSIVPTQCALVPATSYKGEALFRLTFASHCRYAPPSHWFNGWRCLGAKVPLGTPLAEWTQGPPAAAAAYWLPATPDNLGEMKRNLILITYQYHKVIWVRRELRRFLVQPFAQARLDTRDQVAQGFDQFALENLCKCSLHNLSGQPVSTP